MQVTFRDAGTRRGTTPETCAAVVLDTAIFVIRMLRGELRRLRPAGLSMTQLRSLGFVNANPGASASDLSDHLGLTLAATSRLVSSLVRRGLVRQRTDPRDRRRMMLRLTPRGHGHLRTAFVGTRAHFARLFSGIPSQDRGAIIRAMRRLQPLVTPVPPSGRKTHAR